MNDLVRTLCIRKCNSEVTDLKKFPLLCSVRPLAWLIRINAFDCVGQRHPVAHPQRYYRLRRLEKSQDRA